MTKNFKLVLALVLSIMMLMVAMAPALATEPTKYITISDQHNVTVAGQTFKAYKLFDVTYTSADANAPHAYTLSKSSPFYSEALLSATAPASGMAKVLWDNFTFTATTDTTKVVVMPKEGFTTEAAARAFADAMTEYLASITNDSYVTEATAGATDDSVKIDLDTLGDGYYLVTGSAKAKDGKDPANIVTTAVAITTNDPVATILVKADAPSIDKKIDEGAVDKTGEIDSADKTEDTHAVGDKVPYVIETAVPYMTGYDSYWFVVTDELSGGLTYNDDMAIVLNYKTLVSGTHYDVTYSKTADGPYTSTVPDNYAEGDALFIKIAFKSFINWAGTTKATADQVSFYSAAGVNVAVNGEMTSYENTTIDITYSATLNNSAVIGNEGNPNTVKLIYSTNPGTDYDGDQPGPDNDKPIGTTPESKVKTYTTGFELLKWAEKTGDPNWQALAGATFTLEGAGLNKITEVKDDSYTQANDGTFYKLADGTYSSTAPTDATKAYYVEYAGTNGVDTPKYKPTSTVKYTKEGLDSADNIKYTVTTDATGKLSFTGLPEGTYTLTEIEAPTGYNKLEKPIIIKLTATNLDGNLANKVTWTGKKYNQGETEPTEANINVIGSTKISPNNDKLFDVEVENNSGLELPSTGGIGTTIFYVAGSIMVLAAAILLITKRRMGVND